MRQVLANVMGEYKKPWATIEDNFSPFFWLSIV